MMNVFVKSGRIALFKLISTPFTVTLTVRVIIRYE